MNWNNCHRTVLELVERELRLAHELAKALAAESQALHQVNPETLTAATLAKQNCVERLNALDAERRELCAALGLAPDHDGMDRLLAKTDDPGGELASRWASLLGVLGACNEANQCNGVVVSMQKRRVTEALGLLRGESAQVPVYDASGELGEHDSRHVSAEI